MTKNNAARLGMYCCCLAVGMAWGFVCPSLTYAQTDTVTAKQLNEVKISGKKFDQRLDSPTPAQVLKGADLQRLNNLSVADAVRYFSGVQLKDYGGIGGLKTINVRSMGTNHTAVFYNGVQLGNAQNGQVDLGKYALTNIDEVSLYSGQHADLLQPARAVAAASALYLKTTTPVFTDQRRQHFGALVKTGSFGLINPSFNYDQKISDQLSLNVNAELINAHGKYHFNYTNGVYDTTVVRHNADVYAQRAEAALIGTSHSGNEWQLRFYHYNGERGIPGAIVANKFDFKQRQWDDNFFVQGSYQSNTSKSYQLLINAKYAYDFTRYLDPTIVSLDGPLDDRYTQQEAYFSLANVYQLNQTWSLALSADYSFQKLDANLKYFAYPERHTGLVAFSSRLQWPRFNVQANVLATFVAETVENYLAAGQQTEYTPTLMAWWQPFNTNDFSINGFYKSVFRMPTFNDLYYTFVGNTNLRPEYTHQFNLGLRYRKEFGSVSPISLALQTDVYYNRVKDKIIAVPTVNLFRWTMLNLDAVAIKGIETNLDFAIALHNFQLKSKLSYTYEQALDATETGFTYLHQIPYIPLHSGSLTFGASWRAYGLNYSYLYTGERYSQKANIPTNYVPAWYTHDLVAHWEFAYRKISYRLSASVHNLLNQYYDVVLNYPMPGRNFKLSINVNF